MPREAKLLEENVDYELVAGEEESWSIRVLTGEFVETVIAYGNTKIDGTNDDPIMTFDFGIVSSPDEELETENIDLQNLAGDILFSILNNAIKDGSIQSRESK